tara:strand:+ start:587 stop:2698 length:2112 start_codon:yes stop_codon:yes gene_type:complete
MADKFLPEESETVQIFKDKSPIPSFLSPEQITTFTQLIKDNPVGFEDNINLLKTNFPTEFADVAPFTEVELESLDKSAFSSLLDRNKSYKEMAKIFPLEPLSITTGDVIILPDGVSDRFFEKVEAKMQNYFSMVSKVDNFTTDLPNELGKLTKSIGSISQTFVGRISNALQDNLVSFIDGGMAKLASKIFASKIPGALGIVTGLAGNLAGVTDKMFSGMECLTSKVTGAMGGVIKDMLTGMTKNMLNAPTCAIQQFIGGLTNKIADSMQAITKPLLNPILGILGPIGAKFDVKDTILGGIDFMKKVGNIFKCQPPKKQTSSSKFVIDNGSKKDKSQGESQGLLDQAFGAASTASGLIDKAKGFLDSGLPTGLSKFEEEYGQWKIFGSTVGEAADHGIGGGNCYTGNNFSCGPANIDIFGGSGQGATGKVILGNFISKFDKEDMFGTLSRTASIIGVDITNPGEGYAEGPLIDFNDKCNQGRGAYGKAIVDRDMKSPTYGQVTSIVILSPGENFPTDGSEEKEAFIRDVIIEDPGIGYEDAEISDDIRPIIQNGRIAAIEIVEQIPYNRLPDLSVTSDTGYGAIIRPILTTERDERRTDPTQTGVFKVVQCVGAFSSETVQQQVSTPDVVREIEETSAAPVPITTETNVPDTTTTSQTTTNTTTQTGTIDTPSQQTTGQSDTPAPPSPPSGGGSEGSGGGYGGY